MSSSRPLGQQEIKLEKPDLKTPQASTGEQKQAKPEEILVKNPGKGAAPHT